MLTIKEMRVIENYKALLKAGLDKMMAKFIAAKVAVAVVLDVAVSDLGVHVSVYRTGVRKEETIVFRFTA